MQDINVQAEIAKAKKLEEAARYLRDAAAKAEESIAHLEQFKQQTVLINAKAVSGVALSLKAKAARLLNSKDSIANEAARIHSRYLKWKAEQDAQNQQSNMS